jgi:hypothetical protein
MLIHNHAIREKVTIKEKRRWEIGIVMWITAFVLEIPSLFVVQST